MAYKLYTFTNVQKEGFAPELDEQIRLLCDVLYNQREIYPNQLLGRSSGLFLPRPDQKRFTVFFPGGSTDSGAQQVSGAQFSGAPVGLNGTRANYSQSDTYYLQFTTAAPVGSVCGVQMPALNGTASNLYRTSWNPMYYTRILTGSAVDGIRHFCGFNGRPAYTNNNTGILDANSAGFWFRFSTVAGHTTWQATVYDGTTMFSFSTDVAYTADTVYELKIMVDNVAQVADYYINNVIVASIVFPASTLGSLHFASGTMLYNTGGVARAFRIARIYLESN